MLRNTRPEKAGSPLAQLLKASADAAAAEREPGPLILGLDDTADRRWGRRSAARAVCRDAGRSAHNRIVNALGLRWVFLLDPEGTAAPVALLYTDLERTAPDFAA